MSSNSNIILRPYQSAAVEAIEAHWRANGGPALIEMATATGKSLVIGETVHRRHAADPGCRRSLIAVHVQELVEQDVKALLAVWPEAPYGICCEGLGRRDHDAPVIVGTIQSLARDVEKLGRRDLVIVDECFPAGTRIATPFGDQPIENLKPGSAVFNATGVGFVEACRISRTSKLVNLELTDGSVIRCTPNHPIATEQGWCRAGKLGGGARVFSQQDMRELRCRLSSMEESWRAPGVRESLETKTILLAILLGLLLSEKRKSDVVSGSARTAIGHLAADWAQTERARGQWAWAYAGAASNLELAGQRVETGVRGADTDTERQRLPYLLQDRHSQSQGEDSHRIGWPDSCWEGIDFGSEEGCSSRVIRVARVSFERMPTPSGCVQLPSHRTPFLLRWRNTRT
jgi:hypothetical protein